MLFLLEREVSMITSDLLARNVRNRPEREVVFCEPCRLRLTYQEFDQRINKLCNMILHEGIEKGERIAVISPNCHMHLELLMAATKGGWVLVEVDHRLSSKEMEYIVEDSQPRIVFVGRGLEDLMSSVSGRFRNLKQIGLPNEYEKIIASYASKEPEIEVREQDIVTIMYTSGTTGMPKGVIYTHKNLMASVINLASTMDVCEDDKTLHSSPFSHIAPIWPFLLHCYYGGGNVIIKDVDPIHVLKTIEKERITTWNTVPVMISRIVDTEEKGGFDVSSLRWITYGASHIAVPTLRKALDYFGRILNQVYGCTETYVITFLEAGDHKMEGSDAQLRRLMSCGKEMINTETIVIRPDGKPVKSGEIGEVITRGDHVCSGYWRKEEETRESVKNGWFSTGDLATVDDDGFVYITARKKDIIVSGGENVAPREVENALCEHEAVKEATVTGLTHRQWGEAVTGFVVLKPGANVSEADLKAFCRERLAGYKCPKAIVFVKDFPRTTSGKVVKRKIRDMYANKVY